MLKMLLWLPLILVAYQPIQDRWQQNSTVQVFIETRSVAIPSAPGSILQFRPGSSPMTACSVATHSSS